MGRFSDGRAGFSGSVRPRAAGMSSRRGFPGSLFGMIPGRLRRAGKFTVLVRRRDTVVEPFNRTPLDLGVKLFLDYPHHDRILGGHQGKGIAAACRPSGTPDAVDISLRGVGY